MWMSKALLLLYLTKGADLATTEGLIARGGAEANPLMQERSVRVAATIVGPWVTWEIGRRIKSKRWRIVYWVAVNSAWSYAAIHNARRLR